MYSVHLSQPATLVVVGTPVVLPKSVTLNQGWTFLPCPFQMPVPVAGGVPTGVEYDLEYDLGDTFKSQFAFSTFYPTFGWFGSLTTMSPGGGYKLKRVAERATGIFEDASVRRRRLRSLADGEG